MIKSDRIYMTQYAINKTSKQQTTCTHTYLKRYVNMKI